MSLIASLTQLTRQVQALQDGFEGLRSSLAPDAGPVQARLNALQAQLAELLRMEAALRAEAAALDENEERYYSLLHASPEAICLYDAETRRLLEANPAFLHLLGYELSEAQRLTVYDIVARDPATINDTWKSILNGTPVDLGLRHWRHKDGSLRHVQVTATRIRQDGRRVVAAIGRDIGARVAAEARLGESEARFQRLAENAPDIIYRFRLKPDGAFEYISPAVTRLLGFTPEEFYADPELSLRQTHPDDRDALWAVLNNPARTGQLIKIRRIARDGRIVWTEQRPVVLCNEQGEPVAVEGIIRDISAQQQAQEEMARLLEAEHDQRAMAETLQRTAEVLNSTLDFAQVLDQILLHAAGLLPYELAMITLVEGDEQLRHVRSRGHTEMGLTDFNSRPLRPMADFPLFGEVVASGQPMAVPDTAANPAWVVVPDLAWIRSYLVAPLRMKRHITGFISLSSRTPNFYNEAQGPRLQALADQAAVALENAMLFEQLRTGREHLQVLSQRLLEVQETERGQIARELHDEIGQALTGLKLFLEAGHRGPGAPAQDKLAIARSLVEELINRVRDLSLELRPTMLDDLGLVPALLWLFERYKAQTGIHVSFQHFGLDRRFDAELETAAFRIVQEALTNVARYAAVETATVNLWADEASLNVQVEDAGVGFDPGWARTSHPSSGLAGMRERATLLNGQLTIETAPGAGTQITAELPLRQMELIQTP